MDNGSPYSNEQLSFICGSVGTILLHTPVRDGASKGKVERNFRTLKERWLYGIDLSQVQSLEELNRMLSEYIRRHNTTIHSVTGQTPLQQYLAVYDAPMQFIGQKMEVRFLPGDTESAYILYGGEHYPLRLTDRVANGKTRREKPVRIDYGKEAAGNVH